ncbi:MAG: flagellar hook-associated protein FlgK [Nitrospirae bacterium]|nr:flagellar hook-associated protein FlgK [Nitrospirota bacterium]
MGLSALMNVAASALSTMSQALTITGNNISNVNTPGYETQNAILEVNNPNTAIMGASGTGVKLAYVQRQYDSFTQAQMLLEEQNSGKQNVLQGTYSQVENAINDQTGTGLSASITSFFNAWQSLSTNPETPEQRTVVISDGQNIITQAQQIESQFNNISDSIDKSVPDTIKQINNLASQISNYNTSIALTQAGTSQEANDLIDKRQAALTQLAGLVNFSTLDDKSGAVTVIVGDRNLVGVGNIVNPITMQKLTDGKIQINIDGINETSQITGGKLGADLQLKNNAQSGLPAALAGLRTTIAAITNMVNSVQTKGYDLNGKAGSNFFNPLNVTALNENSSTASVASAIITDTSALTYKEYEVRFTGGSNYQLYDIKNNTSTNGTLSGNTLNVDGMQITFAGSPSTGDVFKISPIQTAILNGKVELSDPTQIAAASSPTAIPGGNGNALAMVALSKQSISVLSDSTISEYYASVVATIGNNAASANDNLTFSKNVLAQLQQQNASVSGVSLDEQAMNLVQYQKSYQAAAQIVNVTSTLLDTLVNLVK